MGRRNGGDFVGDARMTALDNCAVCERLNVSTFKAHALLKKFGKMVGRRRVIMAKTLERLISNGEIYFDKGGGVYF